MGVQTDSAAPASTWTVGTLVYNRAGLFSLFGWLLWGDFVLTLLEQVMPSVMPLIFKDIGASNRQIGFILTSMGSIISATLGPVIATGSDRYRSRWGRRRPFLFFFSPFVVISLCAVPFAREILGFLSSITWFDWLLKHGPAAPMILVLGGIGVAYTIFNSFIMNAYYCLMPDVVPREVIGRFYALFRVLGTLSMTVFNYFFLGKALTHIHEIFIGIGVFYCLSIWVVCFKVKEGEYPPLPEKGKKGELGIVVRKYVRECFGNAHFRWAFLAYAALYWSYIGNGFLVFFFRDSLGFSLDTYGKLTAYSQIISMILFYPFGILVDRWGSHKALVSAMVGCIVLNILSFLLIHSPEMGKVFLILRQIPYILAALTILKWLVDTYPRNDFGQFNSAGVLVNCFGGIFLGILCGIFLDWVKDYRYLFFWYILFHVITLVAAVRCRATRAAMELKTNGVTP